MTSRSETSSSIVSTYCTWRRLRARRNVTFRYIIYSLDAEISAVIMNLGALAITSPGWVRHPPLSPSNPSSSFLRNKEQKPVHARTQINNQRSTHHPSVLPAEGACGNSRDLLLLGGILTCPKKQRGAVQNRTWTTKKATSQSMQALPLLRFTATAAVGFRLCVDSSTGT